MPCAIRKLSSRRSVGASAQSLHVWTWRRRWPMQTWCRRWPIQTWRRRCPMQTWRRRWPIQTWRRRCPIEWNGVGESARRAPAQSNGPTARGAGMCNRHSQSPSVGSSPPAPSVTTADSNIVRHNYIDRIYTGHHYIDRNYTGHHYIQSVDRNYKTMTV